jgi:hypothetical protein
VKPTPAKNPLAHANESTPTLKYAPTKPNATNIEIQVIILRLDLFIINTHRDQYKLDNDRALKTMPASGQTGLVSSRVLTA